MKTFLKYLLMLALFWMVLFALQRCIFLGYNHAETTGLSASEIALSWWYALRMDLATTAMLISLPVVLMSAGLFSRKKIWPLLTNIIICVCLVLVILTGLVDAGLYSNWGSKINGKALSYALYPGETAKASGALPVWLFAILFVAETALLLWVYLRFLRARVPEKSRIVTSVPVVVFLLALLPLLYRGGFQKYPIGRNNVYYSPHRILNYAALNGPWNLINVITHLHDEVNPYQYFSMDEARRIMHDLHPDPTGQTRIVIRGERPNILLILMESVSADNLMTLGGRESIMPGLDSLSGTGLSFPEFYASGFRTEQGLAALLSGFPAQPTSTIMREFGKFEKLPNLATILSVQGYHCNYYYSGNIDFANTRGYLRASSFTKILDKDARPWVRTTPWGCLDGELFGCHLEESVYDAQPFFTVIMTSTNHEGFDAPVSPRFPGEGEGIRYKCTSAYTDSCILAYLRAAEKTSWWGTTLVIITSDHAHYQPLNRGKNEPGRHHIPFIVTGGALDTVYRGMTISATCSQVDFPAFILGQLHLPHGQFLYGNDPMDEALPHHAFYSFDNGFGMIRDSDYVVFDHDLNRIVMQSKGTPGSVLQELLRDGKGFLQVMYGDYIE